MAAWVPMLTSVSRRAYQRNKRPKPTPARAVTPRTTAARAAAGPVVLVVLSYREVVTVYTRAGGSYVVARENFGPRVAQIAAVALMVDYVVTVAVQNSAGSAAILSTFPALGKPLGDTATLLLITVAATLLMCYVNLLGVRENGRTFALPTYLFSASVGLMIIVGLAREFFGGVLGQVTWHSGTVPIGHGTGGLITFAAILTLARAFANGGSSLTGIEAVSNAVSALRPPEGRNVRQILVTQGSIVFFLIAGISWIAHITHAVPYVSGVPPRGLPRRPAWSSGTPSPGGSCSTWC